MIYYVLGYRKEITEIAKKFYSHFLDVFFVELVKSFTMSADEMAKRYKPVNIEILENLEAQKKSAIILGAHYANWEWIFNFNLLIKYQAYAVYKKIKNPYFDKKVRQTRGRFNTALVSTKEVFKLIKNLETNNNVGLYGFIGDQSPKLNKKQYWTEFLGLRVPVYTGVEVLSKQYNLPIVFYAAKKIKRGYYECTLSLLVDEPSNFKEHEITNMFLRAVEAQVYDRPEHYLWTHKRFKHLGKDPERLE